MFTFNFNLSEKDFINFNEYVFYNDKSFKKNYYTFKFKLPIMIWLICIFKFILDCNLKAIIFSTILYFLLWIIFMCFFGFTFKNHIKKIVKMTVINTKKNGTLPYDTINTINFNSDEIIEENPNKKNIFKYKAIEKIDINDNYYYIFLNSIGAIIIPKKVIKTKKEKEEFYNFLCKKVGNTKIKNVTYI